MTDQNTVPAKKRTAHRHEVAFPAGMHARLQQDAKGKAGIGGVVREIITEHYARKDGTAVSQSAR